MQGYRKWIAELKVRYRATQIKAAVAVNSAMLEFYWDLGRDIAAMYPGKRRNAHFFENLSNDLCLDIPNPIGLSPSNIRYALRFYELYRYLPQVVEDNSMIDLMKVPWGHHRLLVDKSRGNRDKALFYVRRTIENGWSRTDLQIAIGEGVYEKTGNALTNFGAALPAPSGYLANELIKNRFAVWCQGYSPVGCFNRDVPESDEVRRIVAERQACYDGALAVCDDTGVVIVPKDHLTEEFYQKLEAIEAQEDVWFNCIDFRKWDTFDTVCLKKYREGDGV